MTRIHRTSSLRRRASVLLVLLVAMILLPSAAPAGPAERAPGYVADEVVLDQSSYVAWRFRIDAAPDDMVPWFSTYISTSSPQATRAPLAWWLPYSYSLQTTSGSLPGSADVHDPDGLGTGEHLSWRTSLTGSGQGGGSGMAGIPHGEYVAVVATASDSGEGSSRFRLELSEGSVLLARTSGPASLLVERDFEGARYVNVPWVYYERDVDGATATVSAEDSMYVSFFSSGSRGENDHDVSMVHPDGTLDEGVRHVNIWNWVHLKNGPKGSYDLRIDHIADDNRDPVFAVVADVVQP